MKLFIASDHAGYELKQEVVKRVGNIEWIDLGTNGPESVDYPLFGHQLAEQVLQHNDSESRLKPCGVLICGSGVGVSIAANRHDGIRAVLALREDVAVLSRQHNASNVLCLGSRLVSTDEALNILQAWLATEFEGGRHARRLAQLDESSGARND